MCLSRSPQAEAVVRHEVRQFVAAGGRMSSGAIKHLQQKVHDRVSRSRSKPLALGLPGREAEHFGSFAARALRTRALPAVRRSRPELTTRRRCASQWYPPPGRIQYHGKRRRGSHVTSRRGRHAPRRNPPLLAGSEGRGLLPRWAGPVPCRPVGRSLWTVCELRASQPARIPCSGPGRRRTAEAGPICNRRSPAPTDGSARARVMRMRATGRLDGRRAFAAQQHPAPRWGCRARW